jgi:Copper binding proteins, plastocyanin/azurin family
MLCALAAMVLGSWAVAAGATEPHHGARAASGSQLQVTQVEYRLRLSSTTVRAGAFDLTELDAGREFHDLRLRRSSGGPTLDGRLLAPGHRWSTTVHLSPGVYTLWCSLPEHARLGMHTTLRVTG